ncbi:MAG: transglutaminase-like domain-containing protein, partial [Butyricimonas faecihominis]
MRSTFILLLCCMCFACAKYPGVPEKYHALLDKALETSGTNQPELAKALESATPEMKEGVAFLISYMPERDLKTMKGDDLLSNVKLAYEARNRFAWAKSVPDSIFLNDVLPYASLNEERDQWRADFYKRFAPYVENCKTLEEAIKAVNKNIRDEVKVDYNTAREKPDQNPSESIRQGMASCSGLSILLTDALRSVGIPSRIAGTANWHDNRGNHNWCEVWLDGKWYFTEYYPNELDRSWFLADAGKADPKDRMHAIWASSFKPTGESFPLVWDFNIKYVPAINVTQRYLDIYQEVYQSQLAEGNYVPLKVMMFKDKRNMRKSDDRVAANVDIFCGKDQ